MSVGRVRPALVKDENWALNPILVFIRWIGIDLLGGGWFFLFYSLLCLSLNLAAELDIVIFLKHPELYTGKKYGSGMTATSSWNSFIDFSNYAVHSIGAHLILLKVVRTRWGKLLRSLHSCCTLYRNHQFYNRLHKMSVFGVIYIILSVKISLFTYNDNINE